ncbi:putative defective-in-cullin neddylation protein [Tanacetum coccineum]
MVMDPCSNHTIFQIYALYCEITLEMYAAQWDRYGQANESTKSALSQLLLSVESRVYKRMSILEEVSVLMSRLNLHADINEFSRFYNFVFFICRENGQRSITVSRAVMAWKLVLSGRFRLLNQWCTFVENNQRHNISEDTWKQVLAFSRAWPVLIDEFVEHLYRMPGSDGTQKLICECRDPEAQLIYEPQTGLKVFPGTKRKFDEDSQGQEFEPMDASMISKRRHTDLADNGMGYQQIIPTFNYMEHAKHNNSMGCSKPPCAVEGCLSKGFAELFSGRSCLHFDHETIVSYT